MQVQSFWYFFMIFHTQACLRNIHTLLKPSFCFTLLHLLPKRYCRSLSSSCVTSLIDDARPGVGHLHDPTRQSDFDIVISKIPVGKTDDEVFQRLIHDQACSAVQLSHRLVINLLHRFKNDWKSALGVFRWAESRPGYKHTPDSYDMIVDIMGKMKQMDRMRAFLEEMGDDHLVTLDTIAKAMRRFAGARLWQDAVMIFDDLGTFGLEKNTESMNVLLDTLCKEGKVEQARAIFLELKSHIAPNAHTFNIFIHGWCKVNRVDEAHWSMQEMKGHGYRPCVISYSTIIQFYCHQHNLFKVYELFDEMEAQGCPPNVVTYTTVICSLAKLEEFEEAFQIAKRMKTVGCQPDTLFYNSLIHTLGRVGRVREAVQVFEVEMRKTGVVPNTSTYNSMIAMFCHHALEQKALTVLKDLENSKICKPDVQTYYPLLKSCFKTGKTDNSLSQLLDDMVNKHHLSLDYSAYTLLIHGLCRANKCEWAYLLFKEMINLDIIPKYKTCRLLLDEVKQNKMYDAAEKVEDVMKIL
ncbi:PPR domain-containing protein/PPR_2 domain-containing protein/PPR_3 domain-containing protein [Cephalotus follicularis]|uniref:PPR domain-containing protein/PPR_2 domain-containing protein/PPR_3 domain-containing protein n=1 Tax=Cephalotus follicularis TaxID=3775 RepID=A0A1Q3B378_CEPFO|nr:PPR domain-containing protein/PPR_2 domain-containing protein/PPR_3 domain-containing protein [Cephalotus follicularis]